MNLRKEALILSLSHTWNEHRILELIPVLGSQPAGERSYKPGGRLPILFVRPAVTFPATEHHRSLAGTKLYCWWQRHMCVHSAWPRLGFEPATCWSQAWPPNHLATTKAPAHTHILVLHPVISHVSYSKVSAFTLLVCRQEGQMACKNCALPVPKCPYWRTYGDSV